MVTHSFPDINVTFHLDLTKTVVTSSALEALRKQMGARN